MKQRTLQIEVQGPVKDNPDMIRYHLIIDGRRCAFFTSESNFEALVYDKVFITDPDRGERVKRTNVFIETLEK